jgi:hypothetical protein
MSSSAMDEAVSPSLLFFKVTVLSFVLIPYISASLIRFCTIFSSCANFSNDYCLFEPTAIDLALFKFDVGSESSCTEES